jgi:ATP-dependent helicase HrpA
VLAHLDNPAKLALSTAPHAGPSALFDDCLAAAVDLIVDELGGLAWDRPAYERLLAGVRSRASEVSTQVMRETAVVLARAREIQLAIKEASSPALLSSLTDLRDQLAALVHPGFVTATGARRLGDLDRYLQAMQRRLEKLPERPDRDRVNLAILQQVQQEYAQTLAELGPARARDDDVQAIRWMIEELRVSLFGAGLRTAYPVSPQRITKALAALPAKEP